MSYRSLLKMRCQILRAVQAQQDGLTYNTWETVDDNARCALLLGFIRSGIDPVWTPETKDAQNRFGVLYLFPGADAEPGDRIEMINGPGGTFEITSDIDEAWKLLPKPKLHHLECRVEEVNRTLRNS